MTVDMVAEDDSAQGQHLLVSKVAMGAGSHDGLYVFINLHVHSVCYRQGLYACLLLVSDTAGGVACGHRHRGTITPTADHVENCFKTS
jgi:hypothetical protein